MTPMANAGRPKDDAGYFDRLSMAIFTAGLNWRVVEKKWPGFREAFLGFSPSKVAKMTDTQVRALMKDEGIVRNERKIRATVENAKAVLAVRKEFGSMGSFLDSFAAREVALQDELQSRFRHLGPSTARTFLWMVGHPLTPTREERTWMKAHRGAHKRQK